MVDLLLLPVLDLLKIARYLQLSPSRGASNCRKRPPRGRGLQVAEHGEFPQTKRPHRG